MVIQQLGNVTCGKPGSTALATDVQGAVCWQVAMCGLADGAAIWGGGGSPIAVVARPMPKCRGIPCLEGVY